MKLFDMLISKIAGITIEKGILNAKLIFISDNMFILGCDIESEIHYIRVIDTKRRELSNSTFHLVIV